MQTTNRLFDDLARVANGAMSAATAARQEVEQIFRQQFERFLNERDLVTREEFEAVREQAAKARSEQEALALRVEALAAQLAASTDDPTKSTAQSAAARKPRSTKAKAS